MLVAQATDARTLRGVAHVAGDAAARGAAFHQQIARRAAGGQRGAGRWRSRRGRASCRWTAIHWQACLAHHFDVSEQLPTVLVLAANAAKRCGPAAAEAAGARWPGRAAAANAQDLWEESTALLATLGADELLQVDPELLLRRLFGAHDLRLFEAEPAAFACRCDRERVSTLAARAGSRGNRFHPRGAGRGDGDLRVLPEALSLRCGGCCSGCSWRVGARGSATLN